MPGAGLPEPCHQPHPQQIPPEPDCHIHISGCHGKVVDTVEFDHGFVPLIFLIICLFDIKPLEDYRKIGLFAVKL